MPITHRHVFAPGAVKGIMADCRHCPSALDHPVHDVCRRPATAGEREALRHLRDAAMILRAEGRNGHIDVVRAADELAARFTPESRVQA